MQKHVSWIVALVVGIAAGFLLGRTVGVSGLPGGKKPSDLPAGSVREADLPKGTLAGLSDAQKYQVLKGVSEKYNAQRPPARPVEDPKAVYKIPIDDSPVKGPANALVTIVESSDFQCPFCKRALPTLKQIEQAYPGKVRFAFKHNPLSFHERAMPSAIAAEEARAQGQDAKFWAMHDKLFEAQNLDQGALERAGEEIGLNLGDLRSALSSMRHQARIRRDQTLVTSLGATGTPAFFINGRKLSGAQPFESFRALIDEELKRAEEMVKAGTPADQVYARIIEKGATAPVMIQVAGQGPTAQPTPPPPPPLPTVSRVALRVDDPARGPKNAKVTVVLFSDFQCPFCSRVGPTLKQLEQTYGKDLRIVWKHQPLPMHPNAKPAAEAAEAAREQGKFWEMHDLMFANQQNLSPANYEAWAKQIGLDLKKFKAAIDSHRFQARIEEDSKLGSSVGASGTPTLFVNGRQIVGAQPFDRFKTAVDEELKKADVLVKQGVPVDGKFYERIVDENLKTAPTAAKPEAPKPSGPVQIAMRPDDPVKGSSNAPVTIVEFSDFQCPFCSRVEPTMKQVEQTYGKSVRIVWKHQPLPMHPNAVPAALAAEAARQQGKFWQMHEKLFANQTALSQDNYEKWAKELGLDLDRFRSAMQDPKNRARVDEDQALAGRVGADGTPTFFVNGEKVVGAQPFEEFKRVIDSQLQKVAKK